MSEPMPGLPGPTDPAGPASDTSAAPRSAGAMLKAAREREGLHLAVLAATIKVAPAKLEALEQDRFADLPNATFARALAQSVCRSLKIDPRPVLALLPQLEVAPLEGAVGKLNAPFQERPSHAEGASFTWSSKPMFWAGGLLLVAALVVGLMPPDLFDGWTSPATGSALPTTASASVPRAVMPPEAPASAGLVTTEVLPAPSPAPAPALQIAAAPVKADLPAAAASAATPLRTGASGSASASAIAPTIAPTSASVVTPAITPAMASTGASTNASTVALAASPPASNAVGAGLLRLSASAASWCEVLDAEGQPVFSRIVQPGESVAVNGKPPLRVRVGNVAGTSVTFRGRALDLAPYTRDNVARLELR